MTEKIKPTKKVPRFEKYNCSGKLRVEVKANGEIEEVILMPKKGGCHSLLELIGRLITFILECNIDINYLLKILDDVTPCTAPKERQDFKDGKIPKEELGFGGCSRIIAEAIRSKLGEISK